MLAIAFNDHEENDGQDTDGEKCTATRRKLKFGDQRRIVSEGLAMTRKVTLFVGDKSQLGNNDEFQWKAFIMLVGWRPQCGWLDACLLVLSKGRLQPGGTNKCSWQIAEDSSHCAFGADVGQLSPS